jgi:hypothetical protein
MLWADNIRLSYNTVDYQITIIVLSDNTLPADAIVLSVAMLSDNKILSIESIVFSDNMLFDNIIFSYDNK